MTHSALSSKLWLPLASKQQSAFERFLEHDQVAGRFFQDILKLRSQSIRLFGGPANIVAFPFTVDRRLANIFNTMHGGAFMTMIDACSAAHFTVNSPGVRMKTECLSTQFFTAQPVGLHLISLSWIDVGVENRAVATVSFLNPAEVELAASLEMIQSLGAVCRGTVVKRFSS